MSPWAKPDEPRTQVNSRDKIGGTLMCGDDDRLRSLYRALRSIPFDPLEKPSPWENVTDVLEILAVWQGIKPAQCGSLPGS